MGRSRLLTLILTLVVGIPLVRPPPVDAQALGRRSTEGRYRAPLRSGLPPSDGGFTFCRLWYDAVRRLPSGLGWSTDYPAAEHNFMTRLEELTSASVTDGTTGSRASRRSGPPIRTSSAARSSSCRIPGRWTSPPTT